MPTDPSQTLTALQDAQAAVDDASERLVSAAIAHITALTQAAYPGAARIVTRRTDTTTETLSPLFVLDADGTNISGDSSNPVYDPGRKQLSAWQAEVADAVAAAGRQPGALDRRTERREVDEGSLSFGWSDEEIITLGA